MILLNIDLHLVNQNIYYEKNSFFFLLALAVPHFLNAQNVGIGTSLPISRLHVEQGNVLFNGPASFTSTPGPFPVSGAGTRLMWYPDKGAFRAGFVDGLQWDTHNIGRYSVAAGWNTKASGDMAVAMGLRNSASGYASTAFGGICTASGYISTAFGFRCTASGVSSTAFGEDCTASGSSSTAFGAYCTASGSQSVAMGTYVSTSGFTGAFALGDASTTTVMGSFVANGFRARFAGGYRLLTNSAASIGVVLLASGNAWSAISDVNIKENFLPVDGEAFLKKIAAMPQVTWNYIGQDAKTLRHYGPMAQDFYKAFGRDGIGEIGCDTLINQQDFLGVNFIAIQALEKRSSEFEKRSSEFEKRSSEFEKENTALKSKQLMLEAANKDLTEKLELLDKKMDAAVQLLKEETATKK